MRITQDTLLKIARETITRRARRDHGLVAAYLCGSLLEDDFLLGGTGDVDLFIVHAGEAPMAREIERLTDEVHLDIAHHVQRDYRQPRELRVHPWLGPLINACSVLHDPQHFLDFTQASVRGQFDRADHVMERSRWHVERGRAIWLKLQEETSEAKPGLVLSYLRAVSHAANAVASLSGPPLTERRFLLKFPPRAEAVGRPGLYPGLLGLLGAPNLTPGMLEDWLYPWNAAFDAISGLEVPVRLHPDRRAYYQGAFEYLTRSPEPQAALWPLLYTWTMAIELCEPGSPVRRAWSEALAKLGLGGEAFTERITALDAYLDLVDETLEEWAVAHGAWE